MKKKVIGAVVIVAALLGVLGFVKYNEYSAKEPVVKVELGDQISEKPEDYVKANKTALKKTVLDLSRGRHGKQKQIVVELQIIIMVIHGKVEHGLPKYK